MEERRGKEETRGNWKQILVTALIAGVVTVGAGMLLNHFQTREPRLTYSAEDTLPFEGPAENIAIYHVKIESSGKKVVEDVVCQLSFSKATIKQSRAILEPSITYNDIILSNLYRIEIANLNPEENVILSVLASSPEQLPNRPEISLRGKGVTGVEASDDIGNGVSWVIIVLSTIAVFVATYLFIRTSGFLPRLGLTFFEDSDEPKHHDDQRQILSYLCGVHKLNSEVERYLNMPSEASYWSESDRFAMLAVENPMGEDLERRKQVLKDLLEYAQVHRSSEGIVHYNIARIAKAQGKDEEADDHLEKAKRLIPKLIETRVKLDPIWRNK